jgi:hypothetical protein
VRRFSDGHLPALLLCIGLAVAHTWPLATAPAALSLNTHGDALLNEWILAWIPHQLLRDPRHLFDANIFYPAHHTLAFSEPLIVPALAGAPLAWLGGSPVLVFNILMIFGLALTAAAGYRLFLSWTGDRMAALAGASAMAFNTQTLSRLAHTQAVHLYSFPLALLSLDRLIERPRARDSLWLAAWIVVAAATSGYLAVFTALACAIVAAVRFRAWQAHARRFIVHSAGSAVAASVLLLPLYLTYDAVAREYAMTRTLDNVRQFSATPAGFLATAARLHAGWSGGLTRDPLDSFFPGVLVLALAVAGTIASSRRRWALAILAAAGALLALGTRLPVYGWLYAVFPPMHGLRVAARFGWIYLFALAALAAFGLAWIRQRIPGARLATIAGVAAIAIVNIESAVAPVRYEPFHGIPRLYALLADEPGSVVLIETPAYPPEAVHENAPFVFASTAHWRALINGYSGFIPPEYRRLQPAVWSFPDEASVQAMRAAGVTHVMVHPARFGSDPQQVVAAVEALADLERVAIGPDGMRLYRLR